jgi:hypothetical protein
MADTYKILGQSNPSAATLTELYAVPASTQTILSGISVCNRSSVATSFRVSVELNGAAPADQQYLAYDAPIAGNECLKLPNSEGVTLGDTDTVNVYATLATLSFQAFGVEKT